MGLFQDAFDLSSGATLGNIVANSSVEFGVNLANAADKAAYTKFRVENFDPTLRQDLQDIMVRGRLQAIAYPFPTGEKKEEVKEKFFKNHPIITGFGISLVLTMLLNRAMVENTDLAVMICMPIYVGMIYAFVRFVKKLGKGGKKLWESNIKPPLINDGYQYWHIREYVRQALDSGEMTVKDGIVKISNTNLGRQFPDTIEEIEANAFYYKQKLGIN